MSTQTTVRAPIGLDLGARTPEETALTIAAEIIALRREGSGLPLSELGGPIHRTGVAASAGRSASPADSSAVPAAL